MLEYDIVVTAFYAYDFVIKMGIICARPIYVYCILTTTPKKGVYVYKYIPIKEIYIYMHYIFVFINIFITTHIFIYLILYKYNYIHLIFIQYLILLNSI